MSLLPDIADFTLVKYTYRGQDARTGNIEFLIFVTSMLIWKLIDILPTLLYSRQRGSYANI